jgi:hypothetical protein
MACRLKHDANDFSSQSSTLRWQIGLCRRFVVFDGGPRLLYLSLCPAARLCNRCGSRLQSLLAPSFLTLEYRHARFPESLFVLRRARFGLGNIGLRFFDRPFGQASPVCQHLHQRLMHHRHINAIQQHNEYDSGYGPEQ